jgi:diguanylate cyclase (GGDEF)-like protein
MSSNGLRSLGVVGIGRVGQQTAAEPEAAIFRRILGEAFAIVADAIDAGDITTPADVTSAVDNCRAGVAAGLDVKVLDPLAADCFKSTRRFAALARGRATEQRAQVAALVAMVQEAVATIAGSHTSVDEVLAGSAERFEHLTRVTDVQEIHARLFEEVTTLKRMAIERNALWKQTFDEFGKRLTGLETQLDSTRREAAIDPLTSVANRRTFERTCREWMRPNRPRFVMAMTDVDDFKAINDRFGHGVGDRVLVTVAETLARSLRPDDLVARLGGDEFAILAAGLTLQQAQGRLADIVNAVRIACRPIIPEETTLSLSMGIAEFSAGDTPESLHKRADVALYEAKRNGKGRLVAKASPFIRDLLKGRRARGR